MLQPRPVCAVTASVMFLIALANCRGRRIRAIQEHSIRPGGYVSGVGPSCGRNDDHLRASIQGRV